MVGHTGELLVKAVWEIEMTVHRRNVIRRRNAVNVEMEKRRQLAWRAWVASYMVSINQRLKVMKVPEVRYEDMNATGRSQMISEFGKWWKSIVGDISKYAR